LIAIEEVFSFREDWHQADRAKPLVRQYQLTLDSVLESHPDLQRCVSYCVHCGIRFLTDPRCAGRRNLRCPFGCSKHHRRQKSNEHSAAYYRTPQGRQKKERLNARRYRRVDSVEELQQEVLDPSSTSPNDDSADALSESFELCLSGVTLRESTLMNSPMLGYVRLVVRLVEGIELGTAELVRLLLQALRQHSMAYRRRADYVLAFLHKHPP